MDQKENGLEKFFSKKKISTNTNILIRYSTLMALIAVAIIFSITIPSFLTIRNLENLLVQMAVLGIVAVGLTFVTIPGEMDVSLGSVVTLAGVFAVSLMGKGFGLIPSLAAAMIVGIISGLINGLISIYGHISSLIVTLTIGAILDGVSLLYTGGYRLYKGILPSYLFIGTGKLFGIPMPVVIMFVVVFIGFILAHKTVYGRRLFSVGGNFNAARLVGINPKLTTLLAFVFCSLCSAMAGIIATARVGTAEPFVRFGYVMDAFAIVFIGTTTSAEGEPSIPGTLLGIIILGVLSNGMNLIGVPFSAQNILKGVIILFTVLISSIIRNQKK
ncbi:MAG: ABC transporter permease [Clostridiaceae bacterium]|nr:ABC transporter permease [Clostridiaceae bacterium]